MPPERIHLKRLLAPGSSVEMSDIAARIENGAVFIYPTETIYGIGGRFDHENVFQKIIAAKGRSPEQPMILIGASLDNFAMLDLTISDVALRCAEVFWPGLLTMVLPSKQRAGGIGIRVSDHPFITALSRTFSCPLFSTSANKTGVSYLPDPEVIFSQMGEGVDFMIDAGTLPPSLPSTVIRINERDDVDILREGCISAEQIYAVTG